MENSRYSDEQIKEAANISIFDYIRSQGYDYKQIGKEVHIKGYGGLYVNVAENSFFNHSAGKGGHGCIAFVEYMENKSFRQAMETLVGEGAVKYEKKEWKPEIKEKPTEFIPPEKASTYKNMFAYLVNERMIDNDIISDFIRKGILYQTTSECVKEGKTYTSNNIVFLHKTDNGEVCGASEQGANSFKRFKRNYEGTDKDFGFLYKKGDLPDKIVYLFEAPIDLMSFVQLHPEIENAHFVAMEGLKPTIAEHYIENNWLVYSCVDNDAAGKAFNDKLLSKQMEKAFGGECEQITVSDREPPIEYLEAEHNGKRINLFLSDEDYTHCKFILTNKDTSSFVWKNNSNFQIICECKENGVKDFNDLLKMNIRSYEERMEKAWDNNTTPDELAKLAQDANVGVRTRVAANKRLPINVLKTLAEDESAKVRNTARKTLDFLAENSVEERLNIAFNPYTAAEELQKLAYDENARVRLQVANNPNTSMETLKKLVNDSTLNVRQTAQSHIDFLAKNNGNNNREGETEEKNKKVTFYTILNGNDVYFEVPEDWFKKWFDKNCKGMPTNQNIEKPVYETPEDFCNDYIADDTNNMYGDAILDNVVIKDNLSDKLDEVTDIADKISDAIDNGEMDREEHSIGQER